MLGYPITLTKDTNDTILARFLDFPAHTFGDDEAEALQRASELLIDLLDAAIRERQEIPASSRVPSRGKLVKVPLLVELKVEIYRAMRAQGLGKAELARRLGFHMTQVDRLVDVHHASRLDQLEHALDVLGRKLVVSVEAA